MKSAEKVVYAGVKRSDRLRQHVACDDENAYSRSLGEFAATFNGRHRKSNLETRVEDCRDHPLLTE